MLDYFKDRDCPEERLLLSISNYSSVEEDASEYFRINSTTGYLYQIKQFDYEEKTIQCGIMGKEGGFLNITAEDGLHKTSKPLRVMFINIDDAPPVFVDSICSTVCFPCPVETLTAIVHITDQGTIFTNPPAIKAIDPYTVQSNISYTLDVYPTKYTDIIRFDNGTFVLLQPFGNFSGYSEESDITLTVIVQATGSNGQTSDKLFFTLTVSVRPISSTSQQITVQTSTGPTNNTTNTRLSANDVIIIVLATVVGLLLSVNLVYAVYRLRCQKTVSEYNVSSYEELNYRDSVTTEEHNIYTIA